MNVTLVSSTSYHKFKEVTSSFIFDRNLLFDAVPFPIDGEESLYLERTRNHFL